MTGEQLSLGAVGGAGGLGATRWSSVPDLADSVVRRFGELLKARMKNPTFFVLPQFGRPPDGKSAFELVRSALSGFEKRGRKIGFVEIQLTSTEMGLPVLGEKNLTGFSCLALDTRSVEAAKDKIKEVLWPVWKANLAAKAGELGIGERRGLLLDLINELCPTGAGVSEAPRRRQLSLLDHGLFFPAAKAGLTDIRLVSFDHGGGHFYRFRLSEPKVEAMPSALKCLKDFLYSLAADCPNHFFKSGPRMSGTDWPLQTGSVLIENHELSRLEREALATPKYKGAHDNVEVHCVTSDPRSIAVEVPIWVEPGELGRFARLFEHDKCLTGHMDLVRCVHGRIEIWDYKPKAVQETGACLQVLLYAIATSIRTAIPLTFFRCGYFDGEHAFSFEPSAAEVTIVESRSDAVKCV